MVSQESPTQNAGGRIGTSGHARRPLLELWLPADPQAVHSARRQVMAICRHAGVEDADYDMLDLALGEALANAVVHGQTHGALSGGAPVQDICLSLWNYRDRLILEIHDRGPGFEPPLPPYPMPAPGAQETHGRGLPLMEMLTDALMVCRGDAEEGGASIYLVKSLTRKSQTSK